jgi:hypothetical protein
LIIRIHYRKKPRNLIRRKAVAGAWAPAVLAAFLLAGAAAMIVVWQDRDPQLSTGVADSFRGYLDWMTEQKAKLPGRIVYPYSVIPGGVSSPEDVLEAMRRDPVVARHYAGFDARRARVETLRQPRLAYVSYRVKDRVYFTRKPVRLFAGEQVITDGKTAIRARCGNKVEEAPQAEVSAEEPPEQVLNTPKLEAETQPEKAEALGAPKLESPRPEEETPLAAVVTPPGFAPLDIRPAGPGGVWLTPPPVGGGFLPPAGSPPGGAPPATPPVAPPSPSPEPPPVSPPPSVPPTTPPGTPPVTPPPVSPPATPPPATPPVTPPGPGPEPPPVTPPPSVPPTTPPGSPPVTPPPASPPPAPPVVPPAGPPPSTLPPGGDIPIPPAAPPPGTVVPPPGPLPPPLLPPPSDPEPPASLPPPDVPPPPPPGSPPPEVPEPPPIPEPGTWAMMAAGLLALAWARRGRSSSAR